MKDAVGGDALNIAAMINVPSEFWTHKPLVTTVVVSEGDQIVSLNALVDTGATGYAFIDKEAARRVCKRLKISPFTLKRPKPLKGFDGKLSEPITQSINPTLQVQGHSELTAPMLITTLGQYEVILGKPWLQKHAVWVHPVTNELLFTPKYCDHVGADYSKVPPLPPFLHDSVADKLLEDKDLPGPLPPIALAPSPSSTARATGAPTEKFRPTEILVRSDGESVDIANTDQSSDSVVIATAELLSAEKEFTIFQIGAAPYVCLAHQPGVQSFQASIQDIDEAIRISRLESVEPSNTTAPIDVAEEPANTEEIKAKLPAEYASYLDVFDRSKADELPPHREYDHKIELDGTGVPPKSQLYRMSGHKLEKVKEYLTSMLEKGFITPSKAPYSSPVLFAQKANGDLRFCVDYRKLNTITKRNRYPLPLIEEVLARIFGCQYMTRLDIIAAFNKLRMHPDSEDLTTFVTSLGAYKYRVLPFGLTNGPASYQQYMNDVFFEYLNRFVQCYLDDILIYSKSLKEHHKHIALVLDRLREAGLQADIRKCEFHVKRTKFLGLILTTEGLEMDPEKVKAVKDWTAPTHLKAVQGFIGFCNFYRRFINEFSKLAKPLTALTKKDAPFVWGPEQNAAFEKLKDAMIAAPILKHFDPKRQAILETDASDYVTGGVLSQRDDEGVIHPVAFFSKNMLPAECNYHIYDKELLAIIKCLEHWRPDLEGLAHPISIYTDHKGLEYFMQNQKLTPRQARYLNMLSEFNFQVMYQTGKQNSKADALTRMSDAKPTSPTDERVQNRCQTILTPDRLAICAFSGKDEESKIGGPTQIYERILDANKSDSDLHELRQALLAGEKLVGTTRLKNAVIKEGVLYRDTRLWVPDSFITELVKHAHDLPASGHPGRDRTLALIDRYYYWPGARSDITRYVANCHTCLRTKPSHRLPNGLLHPNSVPEQRWKDLAADFITGLPMSEGKNAILTVICRMSKERHYIPCTANDEGTTAEEMAHLFSWNVWRLHGLPSSLVSDRGPQFISTMWQSLCKRLGISVNISTSHHPETDGQSERANQDIETSLRAYVNHFQDDWVSHIPDLEFAHNNAVNASIEMSPFFVNKGFHPRMSFSPDDTDYETTRARLQADRAKSIANLMEENLQLARANMKHAQEQMCKYANKHRHNETFGVGDEVLVDARHITTDRPAKKLDDKRLGPYKIIEAYEHSNFKLDLPASMRCFNKFHASKLTHHPDPDYLPLPGQKNDPPGPVVVGDNDEYELDEILASRRQYGRLQYRVKWSGWDKDLVWYNADGNEFTNAQDVVNEYHRLYPDEPGPHNSRKSGKSRK